MPVNQNLVISVCSFLIPEVAEVIKHGDYPDVKIQGFHTNCAEKSISFSQISEMIYKNGFSHSDILLFCGSCFSQNKTENKNIKVKTLEQCFELVINQETVSHYIARGFYLVTNGWLRTYEAKIRDWGFDKNTAKTFFRESMKGIVLLDTKIPGDYLPDLQALSEYMGLDYEILPVGLSHCKSIIDSEVSAWRAENERRSMNEKLSVISRQSSDYSVINSQLETLVNLTEETSIINSGFDLLNILFAPSEVIFEKIGDPSGEKLMYQGLFKGNDSVKDESFNIDVYHLNELLGTFKIKNIQFPQHIEEYKKMSKLISQIFGLSIANARKYKTVLDQNEKIQTFSHELQKTNSTKDKFFSIIAHDLKSPFVTLLGFSNLLIKEINLLMSEARTERIVKIEKYGSLIRDTSNKTYSLLTNLLEWSQSQTGRMKYNPGLLILSNLTNEITGLLGVQAKVKNITLIDTISPELNVYGDFNMIMTIIRNLLSNAIKYTPENGLVTLSASAQNNMAQISVSDTGVGISKEQINKLFLIEHTKSTPGTNKEPGTGLGLILCKEFVEKHKGILWVESQEGQGSTFYFSIPVYNTVELKG